MVRDAVIAHLTCAEGSLEGGSFPNIRRGIMMQPISPIAETEAGCTPEPLAR